ncbi:NADPH-dependent FMN reductase [Paenibacillus sp. R14(2021)]|uniref:NADPH-dependent FMN reductase n=1 Tax=Paenibacillus sp. R14(2021) TaxID=2859228 RepID=UPI001C6151B8|nr:NADPH-dependent FMN reductase [Paenibacillus sp. R14(2021)]
MPKAILISGSPNPLSRLTGILNYAEKKLTELGWETTSLQVASLPADDLIQARFDSPAIVEANRLVEEANAVIIASPVYKAAYTGVLKTYLDLLPQKGLAGKVVLPLLIGGTPSHLLAIDFALKPLLSALQARHVEQGAYAVDSQIIRSEDGQFVLDEALTQRLDASIAAFAESTKLFARPSVISSS